MGVRARTSAGVVFAALAVIAAGPAASSAGATAASGGKPAQTAKLVSFVRPTEDTLIQKGTGPFRVVVHVRDGARLTKVDVDGVDVTRLLRPSPGGNYGALLRFGAHLHYGYNDAIAQAMDGNGHRAISHVRFIVAKRDTSLLRVTSFRTETTAAPLQVGLRETTGTHVRAALSVADGVSARVYVNDRRVDRGFLQEGRRLNVALGAGQGLRFGRNRVQILVHKTHAYKRQSRYDMESRTVYIPRTAPIASAGANHTRIQDGFVQFNGRATKLPPGSGSPTFRWRIVHAPKGSRATLRNARGSRPILVPDRPGRYQVRVSVRAPVRRARHAVASAAVASAAVADQSGTSNDTATAVVLPDIPPAGMRLATRGGSVDLDGQAVPDTQCCNRINYVVLDRQTLERTASGSVVADAAGMQSVGAIIDQSTGSMDHLVVLDWFAPAEESLDLNAFNKLLQKIGGRPLPDGPGLERVHVSAVGVAGAPAGSAFVSRSNSNIGLSGSLRLNGVTGKYDFVFTDPVNFDTGSDQAGTDSSPAELTIQVGASRYTRPNPGGGVAGFHLLVLNAGDLRPATDHAESVYTTNAADGAEEPAAVRNLASELKVAADSPTRPLVFLQAFGAPHGNDDAWDQAAQQVERLGGTRQVFNAINAADPQTLNGEDPARNGAYAFVGRVGSTAPLAETSESFDGPPGQLAGVLMRARDGGYEPMLAAPPRRDGGTPVNTELLRIANQAPESFPAFKDTDGQPIDAASAQAVQNFLGAPDVTGLCSAADPVCDIRKSYYQSYRADWPSIQDDLTNAQGKCSEPHQGFTAAQCEGIRTELRDEVSKVAKVARYFGPLGLQQPFGASGVPALANLTEISKRIEEAVQPPATDNTTSSALTALSYVSLLGNATPETTAIGNTLNAAFLLGAYFTREDGSADLIGPKVTTAASKLGVELAERYSQAGDHLDDLGRLIVSDYGKLTAVASKVNAEPGPGETDWRLGNVGQARDGLELAAKRMIYARLVSLAYPVMYDLGPVGNARDWYCDGGHFAFVPLPNKYLFADQADGAQFIGRFTNWTTRIAVAQANAVGSAGDARIRGVPASITNVLFKPIDQGGLGLDKLEFYSPSNGFRYLPTSPGVPVLHDSTNDDLDSLYQWPYNREYIGYQVLFCSDMPNPPGNSG